MTPWMRSTKRDRSGPAGVAQDPLVGRCAAHVAREPEGCAVEAGGDDDARAFGLGSDAHQGRVAAEGFPTTLVDHAGRGAHVRVAERLHVLLQEVDEASVTLQEAEQGERSVSARVGVGWRGRRRRGGKRRSAPFEVLHLGGEVAP
jgi:hypothetical protein